MNDDDLEWYLDNVIVPSGLKRERVGPARQWQAAWDAAERALLEHAPSAAERLAGGQGFVAAAGAALREGLATPQNLADALARASGWPALEQPVPWSCSPRHCRVDGLWRDRDVILEVDGMLKYRASARLTAEKRRQEDLERAGYRVVRILWHDVMNHRAETVERVREALRLGGYRRAYGSRCRKSSTTVRRTEP